MFLRFFLPFLFIRKKKKKKKKKKKNFFSLTNNKIFDIWLFHQSTKCIKKQTNKQTKTLFQKQIYCFTYNLMGNAAFKK